MFPEFNSKGCVDSIQKIWERFSKKILTNFRSNTVPVGVAFFCYLLGLLMHFFLLINGRSVHGFKQKGDSEF